MTKHALSPAVPGRRRALLLPLLLCAHVHAAETDLLLSELAGEEYFLDQVPVVLSATRLAQPQYEAPVAVTVIDRAMIEASGVLDIPDLLRLVPGFQVAHARGHTVAATYHGLADEHARRMQVLVDGRPVYGPALGGVRWTDLPLDIEDVERIEVVRGPNAAAYGANAFLGAINIITQHPAQVDGTELTLLRGNKDVAKAMLRHGGGIEGFDYRVTLGYRRDEGFKTRTDLAPPDPRTGNASNRDPLNDGMRISLFNLRGEYRLSDRNALEFQAGYNGGPSSEGRFDDPVEAPRDRAVQSHFQQLVWHQTRAQDEELRVQFYHTYMRHREHTEAWLSEIGGVPPEVVGLFFPGHVDELVTTNYSIFEERYELEAQHSFRVTPAARLVWGGGARFDRVGGESWYSRSDYIENQLWRLFGNVEWRAYDQGMVNLGTMVERSSQVGVHLSPRVALNHQLTVDHGLRASVSRALRLPTIYEEHADGAVRFANGDLINQYSLGNTDLSAERIVSYELGYLGRWPARHLTLDVKLFHDKLEDRIANPKNYPYPDDRFDGKTFLHTNSGTLSINGAEFALTYRPANRSMLGLNLAYARAKGTALNAYVDDATGAPSYEDLGEDVPRHTLSAFAMHRLPHLVDVSATYYRVSRMKWLGDGDRLDTQDRLDLRIAKHLRGNGLQTTVAFVVQNALDEYLEFRDENVFDTRAYLELTLGLP